MKISNERYPILDILERRDYSRIKVKDSNYSINKIVSLCQKDKEVKKYILTSPFWNAFDTAKDKFQDVSLYNNIKQGTSMFLFEHAVFIIRIESVGDVLQFHLCHFVLDYLISAGSFLMDTSGKGSETFVTSENVLDGWAQYKSVFSSLSSWGAIGNIFLTQLGFLLFIQYAELEQKILYPKDKKHLYKCDYSNNTKFPFTILNCTWFTELVKTEGFKVRGHFRLQPKKKEGEWTKELIWINDFEKTGYTAPARKPQ